MAPDLLPITLGSFSPSVLLRVARSTGVLGRHGLSVEEVAVPSSPAQFAALDDGSLDVALTSPDNVVAYRFVPDNPLGRTMDVRILMGVDRGLGLALYARPGIENLDQLRGKVVGVDVATSGFAFVLYEILDRAGLRAGRDYDIAELGSTPKRLDALLAGQCDATLLNAGNDLRAAAAGHPRLGRAADVVVPYLGTVLAVLGPPSDAVYALEAALLEASAAVLDGSASDSAVREAEGLGLRGDLARRYAEMLCDPIDGLVPGGAVDGLAGVVELRRRHSPTYAGAVDPLSGAAGPGSGLVARDGEP